MYLLLGEQNQWPDPAGSTSKSKAETRSASKQKLVRALDPHYGVMGRLRSGLRIRIHFIRIRIQHIMLNTNTDPDPIRIQGFYDQKLKKNYS
jgi:hypothetical protein